MLTKKLLPMSYHKRAPNGVFYETFRQIEQVTQITCATRFIGEHVSRTLLSFAHTRFGAWTMPEMRTSECTSTPNPTPA